jgi:type II secretory pathway pseudopilin PulG
MKRKLLNKKGFTLIEIITSLIIIMIISVIAGMGLIQISKGYVFFKKNSSTAQQGQIAMTRLKKEISNIKSVTSGTATSITFTRSSGGPAITISWAGGNSPLLIDGDTLAQPLTSFNLTYYDSYNSSASSYTSSTSIIEITLQLRGAEDAMIEFKDRVNLYLETGG